MIGSISGCQTPPVCPVRSIGKTLHALAKKLSQCPSLKQTSFAQTPHRYWLQRTGLAWVFVQPHGMVLLWYNCPPRPAQEHGPRDD